MSNMIITLKNDHVNDQIQVRDDDHDNKGHQFMFMIIITLYRITTMITFSIDVQCDNHVNNDHDSYYIVM